MISTATTVTGLIALFLLGVKWAVDLISEWPRKSPMSTYFEQQRSVRISAAATPSPRLIRSSQTSGESQSGRNLSENVSGADQEESVRQAG